MDPADIEDRRLLVMELRRKHLYWDEISKQVSQRFGRPIGPVQCCEDFRIVMRNRAKELSEETDAIRETAIQQLDHAATKILDKVEAGDLDAVDTYLKIQTRKARLLGLDAPQQREDVTPRNRLTADELLAKMADITKRIQAAKARTALPGEIVEVKGKEPAKR